MSEPEVLFGEDATNRLESDVLEAVITAMRLALADDGLPGVARVCKAFATDYDDEAESFLSDGVLNTTTRFMVACVLMRNPAKTAQTSPKTPTEDCLPHKVSGFPPGIS